MRYSGALGHSTSAVQCTGNANHPLFYTLRLVASVSTHSLWSNSSQILQHWRCILVQIQHFRLRRLILSTLEYSLLCRFCKHQIWFYGFGSLLDWLKMRTINIISGRFFDIVHCIPGCSMLFEPGHFGHQLFLWSFLLLQYIMVLLSNAFFSFRPSNRSTSLVTFISFPGSYRGW